VDSRAGRDQGVGVKILGNLSPDAVEDQQGWIKDIEPYKVHITP